MRKQIFNSGFNLWLSANETYDWAHRPGKRWPCSELQRKRVFVQFDRGGLVALTVNGRGAPEDLSSNELTACVSDYIRAHLPAEHPCAVYLTSEG